MFAGMLLAGVCASRGQERPYFVTYSHALEEPGNLEVALKGVAGTPSGANSFRSAELELEYGATGWWTTEVYLAGQTTSKDSTVFTGYRWENRIRPLLREHWVNPVLYVEFEDINGADRSLLEVVGHDGVVDLGGGNGKGRAEKKREVELKLLLSRNWKGWNFSQNTIFEKNLSGNPWEFGYAVGGSRALRQRASSGLCAVCLERFAGGVEMYGGLGDRYTPGLRDTSHYLSPIVQWESLRGTTFSVGPAFGLNANSAGALLRFKMSVELPQIASRLRGER
ncbi:MAG: hypothetical protein NVSMB3_14890 [Acidobacteriaceae bacterium]